MLFSGTGRHRRTRVNIVKAVVATTGVAGAAVALPLIGASGANAATVSTWDKVAQCESGGDWSINTGNGFYGGLQFSASTWRAYGGGAYASTANHASKAAQITVAERVLASQGPGAWPVCGPRAGLHRGGPAPVLGTSATKAKAKAKAKKTVAHNPAHKPAGKPTAPSHTTGAGTYTVKPGDTLSKIAAAHHVAGGWQALYAENRAVIGGNPNVIHVGEKLVVK